MNWLNIANEFNSFFSSIGAHLDENIDTTSVYPLFFVRPTPHNFVFQTISHDKIGDEIRKMKTAKSSGCDKIFVKLLQAAGGAEPLTYIFNQSIKTCRYFFQMTGKLLK